MTIDSNFNNSALSFKSIKAANGGRQFLEKNIKKSDQLKLDELITSQYKNPVDVVISYHSGKRLSGCTVFEEEIPNKFHQKYYTQRIIETPLKFIERLCKKADKLSEKYEGNIKLSKRDVFNL